MNYSKEIRTSLKSSQIWKLVFWSIFNTKKFNLFAKMIRIGM